MKFKTTLLALTILVLFAGCSSEPRETVIENEEIVIEEVETVIDATEGVDPVISEPTLSIFSDGTYLVGKDLDAGLYKVVLTDTFTGTGYVERKSDLSMEFDSIIANTILHGDGYVEILDTDMAVKIQGAELYPIDLETYSPDIQTEVSDGVYLVGYDIEPGTYAIELTDSITGMGYVQRSSSVGMEFENIIANEIIQGPSYVEIAETDFAVQLQGVKITKQ